jgi:DNA replication protein DnaC
MTPHEQLKQQANELRLYGILAHWQELTEEQLGWLTQWLAWESAERTQRGVVRRLRSARIGCFKSLADFDWSWPEKIDQAAIQELMQLQFITDVSNVILIGSNGVGKSTIAQNLAYQAALQGYSVLFTSAANMLNDLAALDGDIALRRRLKYYAQPQMLAIDEIGYLSYSNRHADLLFEIINRRYEKSATLVTTNRPFSEWGEVFPNSACVVSLIDRLLHHSEIIAIEGSSYRVKEAREQAQKRPAKRKRT